MYNSLDIVGRGVVGEKKAFFFSKEKKKTEEREIDEQVLTGELLYNNEDCSI